MSTRRALIGATALGLGAFLLGLIVGPRLTGHDQAVVAPGPVKPLEHAAPAEQNRPCPDVRFLAISPDGRFRLDFVVEEQPGVAMPGQGSDVGGYVALVGRDLGNQLARSRFVPLLSGFAYESVKWSRDTVDLWVNEADGPHSVSWPLR